jgi:hypothetical protein
LLLLDKISFGKKSYARSDSRFLFFREKSRLAFFKTRFTGGNRVSPQKESADANNRPEIP